MAQTMKPAHHTKDAATDPKTPSPTPDTITTIPSARAIPINTTIRTSPQKHRHHNPFPRDHTKPPPAPAAPEAQQSKKRKLAAAAAITATSFPHLPSISLLAFSPPPPLPPPPPPPPPPPKPAAPASDELTALVASYRTSQSRRAADMTVALKHRADSQEMVATHERWSAFCRGPEIARLDLLRTLDDAVAADREILRVLVQELGDTLEVREKVGRLVDGANTGVAVGLGAKIPGRRVVGRKRGWVAVRPVRKGVVVLVVALVLWVFWGWL